MQKNCEIEELIAKLFSENITPEEKEILTAWLEESPENKAYFAQLKNIWQATHPVFSPENIDVESAELKVMGKIKTRSWMQNPAIVWWQRVAAIIILPVMIVAGYLLYHNVSRKTVAVAYQEIISPFNMISRVDLPDSSTVWLNAGSKLKYPVVFISGERRVHLSGEAFFRVHSDKSNPFIVETEKLNVIATGTKFNVEAYTTDTITAVTLIEGKVDVKTGKGITEKLSPNQRMVLNLNSDTYKLTETDAQLWGAWKDGILVFRDEPLENVLKRIGRAFNVDIRVKDPAIGKQLYRATFNKGESLDKILDLLKMTTSIQYKKVGRKNNKDLIEVYRTN